MMAEIEGCVICRGGVPREVVAELPSSWVTASEYAALPGYACVVSKVHVREPYQLTDAQRSAFFEDCMSVARALAQEFQPVKMNYEIHCNEIPHPHMHLFPRMREDFGQHLTALPVVRRNQADLDRITVALRVISKAP